MRILGISAFYHDSAAALVEDGHIVAAVQEERFTRKKQDARYPENAIQYCLDEGSVKLAGGEVELVINGGPKFKCYISWPTQTLPTKAEKFPTEEFSLVEYINNEHEHKVTAKFPEGLQDRLIFKNEIKGIAHEFREEEPGSGANCEEWGQNGGNFSKNGKYFGSVEQQIAGAELEYRTAEEEPF